MPDYRITAGTHRTPNGERAEAGEVITLSEAEGERFAFKLEEVEDETSESADGSEPETSDNEPEPTETTDGSDDPDGSDDDVTVPDGATDEDVGGVDTVDLPDNYALLSKMAKHYPSEDVHGRQSGDQIRGFLSNQDPETVAEAREKAEAELSGDE